MNTIRHLLCAGLLLISSTAMAGLITTDLTNDPTLTAHILASNLVNSSVTVSNAVFTGSPKAVGAFLGGADPSGGTQQIALSQGIVLSTGHISGIVGPNDLSVASSNNGQLGDADLDILIGNTRTHDAAILEFNFVPTGDSISLHYIFASEEYNEDINTDNDALALYINGVICSTVNGSPVYANTINNGNSVGTTPNSNPDLYINNDVSDNDPTGGDVNTGMDGLTKLLTCNSPVNPNSTNHAKLAIADIVGFDVGVADVDSNVLLGQGSFTSTPGAISVPATSAPISCTGPRCKVQLTCPASSIPGEVCSDTVTLFIKKSLLKTSSSLLKTSRTASRLRMAAGVSNVPQGTSQVIKLKPTKKGKAAIQALRAKGKKSVRGVMEIRNSVGTITSFRIKLKVR